MSGRGSGRLDPGRSPLWTRLFGVPDGAYPGPSGGWPSVWWGLVSRVVLERDGVAETKLQKPVLPWKSVLSLLFRSEMSSECSCERLGGHCWLWGREGTLKTPTLGEWIGRLYWEVERGGEAFSSSAWLP